MPETCPVCNVAVEHVRREEPTEGTGGTASFDIDDMCTVEDGTRWDRICTAATQGDGAGPTLEVYYHFFEDDG